MKSISGLVHRVHFFSQRVIPVINYPILTIIAFIAIIASFFSFKRKNLNA